MDQRASSLRSDQMIGVHQRADRYTGINTRSKSRYSRGEEKGGHWISVAITKKTIGIFRIIFAIILIRVIVTVIFRIFLSFLELFLQLF